MSITKSSSLRAIPPECTGFIPSPVGCKPAQIAVGALHVVTRKGSIMPALVVPGDVAARFPDARVRDRVGAPAATKLLPIPMIVTNNAFRRYAGRV
jgi:hypothetical protein